MNASVAERANAVATFRFIEVRLMETIARWTPTTPEMELKILFGRHIWDFAQHADALGKRVFELRQPEQHSRRPSEPYVALLDEVAAIQNTDERLAAVYDVLLPGLERHYRDYVANCDQILDEPTVVILNRILGDLQRQRQEANAARREGGIGMAKPEHIVNSERALQSVVA